MSPKRSPDYSALALPAAPAPGAPAPVSPPRATGSADGVRVADAAQQVRLLVHPDGHRAIKIHAATVGKKPHDIYIEALERELARLGIRAPVRVQSRDTRPGTVDPQQLDIEEHESPTPAPASSAPTTRRRGRKAAPQG